MELLQASLKPEQDRRQFIKTVFLFWLPGAIDGHAKNFSIFLKQGGHFELTPVYDVISAYPLVAKRQPEAQDLKMATALHSKNTYYHWHEMMPRHWFAQARKVSFPETEMQTIIQDTLTQLEGVIEEVISRLPIGFPDEIATPIFDGMKRVASKFV